MKLFQWIVLYVASMSFLLAQPASIVKKVEYLIEIGDYEMAIIHAERAESKCAQVYDRVYLKGLKSLALFRQNRFAEASEVYQDAKADFQKHDTSLVSAPILLRTGVLQNDYVYLNKIAKEAIAKKHKIKYWEVESNLAYFKFLKFQGYQNAILEGINKSKNTFNTYADQRQKFELGLCKADIYLERNEFKHFDSFEDTLLKLSKYKKVKDLALKRQYFALKAKYYLVSQKDYYSAASLYEKAYSFGENIVGKEYLKSYYLYQTIVNYKRAGKELLRQRFLREAEMLTYQKLGHKDLLLYDLAKANCALIDGDVQGANNFMANIEKEYKLLPNTHIFWSIVADLRYEMALQAGLLSDAGNVIKNSIDSSALAQNTPNFLRLKLKYLNYQVRFGDDFGGFATIKRECYNYLLVNDIGQASKENIQYLDLFHLAFKLNSNFDSSYYYANNAYSNAIKIFDSKQIEYAYYTATMIEASLLAGVKILFNTYLNNIEKDGLKYKTNEEEIYINTIEKLSNIYASIGDFAKAKSVLSLNNYLSSKIIKSPFEKARYMAELGGLFLKVGRYSQAYQFLQESLNISNESLGDDNRFKLEVLLALSDLYNTNGEFNASYDLLQHSKKISVEKYGVRSLQYSEYLKNEARYFLSIGDYDKAKSVLESAHELQKKILPPSSIELVSTTIDLAYISSFTKGDKNKIIEYYDQSAGIIKNTLGENVPLYGDLLKKKGEFYSLNKEFDKSNQVLNQGLTYWNKLLGDKNPNSAEIYVSLGNNHYAQGDYLKSIEYYHKASDVFVDKFSGSHPKNTQVMGKLARAFYMQKKYDDALATMERVIPVHIENKNKFFATMSFAEKSKFWALIKDEFEFYNFVVVNHFNKSKEKIANVFNNTLNTKALLLSNTLKIKRNILNSGDTSLIGYYNQWLEEKELLLFAHSQNKEQLAEQKIDIKELESRIESLEKAISKKSELFSNEGKRQKFTWKSVAGALASEEVVVEIVRIRKFDKYFTDSSQYLVMLLEKGLGMGPDHVVLKNGKELETKYLSYYRNCTKFNTEDKFSYSKFWKPIKEKIPNGKIVYISPDGCYSQINLEMMKSGPSFALDENQFLYLTNSVDLASKVSFEKKYKMTKENKVIFCGSPNFYVNRPANSTVPDLKSTEKEVEELSKKAEKRFPKSQIVILKNEKVIEDSIKKIKSPIIFHIATHGYFKESVNTTDNGFKSNPLLNSGLLLGNSGDIIDAGGEVYVNQKSGILTAYEVSNMDFDHTKLVVLSACETGKGEVQAGEGVLGLVRAFTIAGGEAIINSLFKVQDEATMKFMGLFYDHFIEHQDERAAMVYAKMEMKKIDPQPLNWGAFILYETGH